MKMVSLFLMMLFFLLNNASCLWGGQQSGIIKDGQSCLSEKAQKVFNLLEGRARSFYSSDPTDVVNGYFKFLVNAEQETVEELKRHFREKIAQKTARWYPVTTRTSAPVGMFALVKSDEDTPFIAAVGVGAWAISIWQPREGLGRCLQFKHKVPLCALAASHRLVSADKSGRINIWDVRKCQCISTLDPVKPDMLVTALCCNDSLLCKAFQYSDPQTQELTNIVTVASLENPSKDKTIVDLIGDKNTVTNVALADDCSCIVATQERRARVYKATSDRSVVSVKFQEINLVGSFTGTPTKVIAQRGVFAPKNFALLEKDSLSVGTMHEGSCISYKLPEITKQPSLLAAAGDHFYVGYTNTQEDKNFVIEVDAQKHEKIFSQEQPLIGLIGDENGLWAADGRNINCWKKGNLFRDIDPNSLSLKQLYLLWVLIMRRKSSPPPRILHADISILTNQVWNLYRSLPHPLHEHLRNYVQDEKSWEKDD